MPERILAEKTGSRPLWPTPGIADQVAHACPIAAKELPLTLTAKTLSARLNLPPPGIKSLRLIHLQARVRCFRFHQPAHSFGTCTHKHCNADRRRPSCDRGEKTSVGRAGGTRMRPAPEHVTVGEQLFYLLQPPLEEMLSSSALCLPARPYPYQLAGVAFLVPRRSALLADEMGLGKTMQAIVALRILLHMGAARRVLIVCPKPLVTNWLRELSFWAPEVPAEVVSGDYETRRRVWHLSHCPVKLVNYELLTRDADDIARLAHPFDLVLLDEAQRIKNRDSRTAQVARQLPRLRSWALTGTPIENHCDDLVSLFEFLDPGRLPPSIGPKELQSMTAPYVLRRVREDVLSDLPPRVNRDTYVELTPAQRHSYELAEREGIVRLGSLGQLITVRHVFELILRLKQICNFDPATGESGKLEQLRADLAEVVAHRRKAIVFSQWVEPLEVLARQLAEFGPLVYHGRVPPAHREQILRRFRDSSAYSLLLMSYGAGSVGLNLQCANYVFLFDRWWNPAVEEQAIHRVHRIGQKDPVIVTRYLVPDTVESRIAAILERKRALSEQILHRQTASSGLTQEELFSLFGLETHVHRVARTG